MLTEKIAIMGCGWLGLPLAKRLIIEGVTIHGSTSSKHKLPILEEAGITPFLLNLSAEQIEGDITGFLSEVDTLILNIPPKLRGKNPESYVEKILQLLPYLESSSVKNILFISSTSVYADKEGFPLIDEQSATDSKTQSGIQLKEVELLLQNNPHFTTTILRFGGLIGAGRHPIKQLAGRTEIKNPEAPINLIHLKDCIGVILAILSQKKWNHLFNAVAPFHPKKEKYYQKMSILEYLSTPYFNHSTTSKGKEINGKHLSKTLSYEFEIKNLLIKV